MNYEEEEPQVLTRTSLQPRLYVIWPGNPAELTSAIQYYKKSRK